MEITLTNNFYRFMAMEMFGNNTALGTVATNTRLKNLCPTFQKLVATDDTEASNIYYGDSNTNSAQFHSMGAVSAEKTNDYSQLRFDIGSNGEKATKADNKLTALVDTSYTVQTEIKRYVENDFPKVRYIVTITAESADITFTEIGMIKKLMTINTSYPNKDFLLGRVVVPETTISAGNSKVFDIDVTIPS